MCKKINVLARGNKIQEALRTNLLVRKTKVALIGLIIDDMPYAI